MRDRPHHSMARRPARRPTWVAVPMTNGSEEWVRIEWPNEQPVRRPDGGSSRPLVDHSCEFRVHLLVQDPTKVVNMRTLSKPFVEPVERLPTTLLPDPLRGSVQEELEPRVVQRAPDARGPVHLVETAHSKLLGLDLAGGERG